MIPIAQERCHLALLASARVINSASPANLSPLSISAAIYGQNDTLHFLRFIAPKGFINKF
jgi:hypothetical protein